MKAKMLFLCALFLFSASAVWADTVLVNTGSPDGKIGMASRPDAGGKAEIEAADDFITTASLTHVNSATFTGLLTGTTPVVGQVVVEIYRVFPLDSGIPSGNVPTRANSPSDVAFDTRDSAAAGLSFSTTTVNATFTASNSVLNGINKSPNQKTLGEGPITGEEVTFTVTFTTPFDLPANHYFFVPQVQITGGEFYWLSSPRPISGNPFSPDLQAWIRNANLDPDWLRVGTDIVGTDTFNGSFTLNGTEVPEPSSLALLLGGIGVIARKLKK